MQIINGAGQFATPGPGASTRYEEHFRVTEEQIEQAAVRRREDRGR